MEIEGVKVKIGRREFTVPPITMWAEEQCERLAEAGKSLTSLQAARDSIAEQVRVLLEPNYPDLTVAEVKKDLPGNSTPKRLQAVLQAVMAAACEGVEVAPPGEAVSP